MADKSYLEGQVFSGTPALVPASLAVEFEELPDDQTLFEFAEATIEAVIRTGGSARFAAGCIASGLLDLGFKR